MMYALVTKQGTAAAETALCHRCFQNDSSREFAKRSAGEDVDTRGWLDVSENDALECVSCGHTDAFPVVILDSDGVVDRVATEQEARDYIASMPAETLRYEVAAMREP